MENCCYSVPDGLYCRICEELFKLGVPPHLKGHDYLIAAVAIVADDPTAIHAMTKRVYPTIAEAARATPASVERSIRTAVEWTFTNGGIDTLRDYFGPALSPAKGKTTNAAFIMRLALAIRMREQKKE